MCGIAITSGFDRLDIHRILNSQSFRGESQPKVKEFDSGVCMGHNRLSIIDLSEDSNQPINSGKTWMSYNGEIYNYKSFSHLKSDTQSLVELIDTSPANWMNVVEGMYAVATYNEKSNVIKLTTDPFNQKPVYYYFDGLRFAAASTPAALTTLKDKWELDQDGLDSLFCLGAVIGERSLFKGIQKLPGGYELTFDCNTQSLSTRQWYQPLNRFNPDDIEDVLNNAIEQVKVSDVPIHLFLSGGIDSTIIASKLRNSNALHLQSEELSFAKKAASKYGISLIEVPISGNLESIKRSYTELTGDCAMSCVQPYIVSKALAKYGKVGIIANGADELFFGYDRMQWTIDKQLSNIFRPGYEIFTQELMNTHSVENYPMNRFFELFGYVQYDLNKTLDHASMIHTTEIRSPFLNRDLVETSMQISMARHTNNGKRGKDILKRILERQRFDAAFTDRRKVGFSLPKSMQYDGQPDLEWCIQNGFVQERNDWSARDLIYTIATATCFRQWFDVWKSKLA